MDIARRAQTGSKTKTKQQHFCVNIDRSDEMQPADGNRSMFSRATEVELYAHPPGELKRRNNMT